MISNISVIGLSLRREDRWRYGTVTQVHVWGIRPYSSSRSHSRAHLFCPQYLSNIVSSVDEDYVWHSFGGTWCNASHMYRGKGRFLSDYGEMFESKFGRGLMNE